MWKINRISSFLKTWVAFAVCLLFLLASTSMMSGVAYERSIDEDHQIQWVNIKKADLSGVEFSLSVEDFMIEQVMADRETFQRLTLPGGGRTAEYGKAELPTLSFYLAVPQGATVQVSYEHSDEIVLPGYKIYPAQPPTPDIPGYIEPSFQKNESFYSLNEFYPKTLVNVDPIVVMRGCRIAMVTVFPFTYNPEAGTLKVYSNIHIVVDFIGGSREFIPERLRSLYFQPLYDAFLLNAHCLERVDGSESCVRGKASVNDDRADLLIVVDDQFYPGILPLATWRHQTGIETKVVNWSEIGTTAPHLRAYMSDAYLNWELPPSFLLIVGDADHIPTNYLYMHPYYDPPMLTGTDHWYAAVDGSDYLPDLHAARISVDNTVELSTVITKILGYSKTPYMDVDWFDDVLLAAYEEYGRYFVWTSNTIYSYLSTHGYTCNRQYENGNPSGSTSGVINAINNGVIIANHRDHGTSQNSGDSSYTGWSHPQFTTDHITYNLNNGEKYPVMFSLNCESGWFDGETDQFSHNYESIGEVGLRVANKGFVAVIAATRVSYSGYNDELCRGFYDAMFPEFDPAYPNGEDNPFDTAVFKIAQVMNYGKFWMYDKYIVPGGCDPYPWTPSYEKSRVEFEMFHDFGDPTMEIWTQYPKAVNVSHPSTLPLESSTFLVHVEDAMTHTPVDQAYVCLWKGEEIYMTGYTDVNGDRTFYPSPMTPGTVDVTVTKHNYLPYEGGADVAFSVICGDNNCNGVVDVGDVVYLINYLFRDGDPPQPVDCVGDCNADGEVTVGDVVYLINHLFKGGPEPVGCCG